ncbi:hypothetical protein [Wenyingzhuangia sp. 2_MG-2023]|uniref:hypothetical protein n=1 Tax=Wenyingzhuangia sp. 2_MG-2023 TaxID=3062639 RepID=UPI0026E17D49|nr:hypothetical protein [Wenyingzhuangia sp. 2_MG-2023]MDO6738941.1 hypothetical protein [Wenyingzhuangia sp. 2_MG-2023]MDO6803693.1 hypothetical protein [Wenyingzhuangia sp. 1_MG-2023]
MILKLSKFFGTCYSDDVSELQFFGKRFQAEIHQNILTLSFELMKGLDKDEIEDKTTQFTFYEIEDLYLQKKLSATIQNFSQVTKITLCVNNHSYPVKHLKLTYKGFVLRLV